MQKSENICDTEKYISDNTCWVWRFSVLNLELKLMNSQWQQPKVTYDSKLKSGKKNK